MAKFVSEKIKMRTSARLAAVQATYMAAYGQLPVDEVIKEFLNGEVGRFVIEDNPENGNEEFREVEPMDKAYFEKLVRGVQGNKEELEKSLNLFLNAGRTLERLQEAIEKKKQVVLDINVRLKVIQEYVDMAYAFFSKGEPKMVNALLDQIAREVRSA